jgi:hypothetical protein
VFVFADKTHNIYEVPPSTYTKLLTENITKTYKTENEDITGKINKELKELTNNLGIGNRIDIMAINRRISSLSSSELAFDSAANVYEEVLHKSNYNGKLEYSPDNPPSTITQKRKRQRNIIWFNPPFSKNVRSNIALNFLRLLDKHFPKANPLHKIFNRNSIKVSYSCMENVKSSIARHNKRVLAKAEPIESPSKLCNCRIPNERPLQKSV